MTTCCCQFHRNVKTAYIGLVKYAENSPEYEAALQPYYAACSDLTVDPCGECKTCIGNMGDNPRALDEACDCMPAAEFHEERRSLMRGGA